jgi:sugar phosphate isomerase/epimerase
MQTRTERVIPRRDVLSGAVSGGLLTLGAATGAVALHGAAFPRVEGKEIPSPEKEGEKGSFRISLNTSTLRGHKLPLGEVIDITAKAGYGGIEPWPDEIDRHLESGGSLKDIDKRLKDHGLKVTGAIAFFEWMVDDETKRAQALDEAKRRMEKLAVIGASHIAAPPAGDVANVDLLNAAERYRALLEVSESFGVTPSMEVWGFAKNAYRLGQCALIALEARHPKACVLPDVYHLYKGGSGFGGIRRLNGSFLAGFHLNDYPASPPRETIRDADRVYPGDGIAPLKQLFRDLRDIGYQGPLSIELFNPEYYKQDPLLVAKTALEKTKTVMQAALE